VWIWLRAKHPKATVRDLQRRYLNRWWLPIDVADRIFDRVSLDDIERCERATYSFRWILIHLIEEYPRHCGHADLLRQAIDGATGD
jgi:Protein of unknown function (DUF664)